MKTLLKALRDKSLLAAAALLSGTFWGVLAAIGAQSIMPLSEDDSLVFVALPVGLLVVVWLWPKLPALLGIGQDGEA